MGLSGLGLLPFLGSFAGVGSICRTARGSGVRAVPGALAPRVDACLRFVLDAADGDCRSCGRRDWVAAVVKALSTRKRVGFGEYLGCRCGAKCVALVRSTLEGRLVPPFEAPSSIGLLPGLLARGLGVWALYQSKRQVIRANSVASCCGRVVSPALAFRSPFYS